MASPKFNVELGLNSTINIQCNRAFISHLINIIKEFNSDCGDSGHVGHAFLASLKKAHVASAYKEIKEGVQHVNQG